MYLIHLIVSFVLLQYVYFGILVGRARGQYGVAAPATTGHAVFERYFRAHMNTLELLVAFIPAVYGFGLYFDPRLAAALGAVFFVGRFLYFFAYVNDPKSRTLGYALSALPTLLLILGTTVGAVLELVHVHG
jgi:glutathione S-transferase